MLSSSAVFIDPRASPRGRPPSPARSPSDVALRQIIAEKTKLEGEILGYKQKLRNSDGEIDTLKEKVSLGANRDSDKKWLGGGGGAQFFR